jgi:hypothetical protein
MAWAACGHSPGTATISRSDYNAVRTKGGCRRTSDRSARCDYASGSLNHPRTAIAKHEKQ